MADTHFTKGSNLFKLSSETSSATPTVAIETGLNHIHSITALAADITSMTTNLSGTPRHGQMLLYEITGTATRAITWGASFASGGIFTLPTTTVGTTTLRVLTQWDSYQSKLICVGNA